MGQYPLNPNRFPRFLNRLAKNSLCILILAGAVLVLLHRIFVPGFLVYRDNPAHLAEAYAYVESLRQGGSFLDGWSMSNSAGYPLLLYYPKTCFWLIAALHFLLSMSVILAYKLVMFLSILLPVIGVFLLLRKAGNILAALFCSLLFLVQNNLIHYALSGMSSNAMATGVLFLFATVLFAFTDDPTERKALAAGLLLGALTLTHLYITVGGAILWASIFVLSLALPGKDRRSRSLLLLIVPAVGLLTSCFYTYQLVKTSGWLTPAEGELQLVSFRSVFGNLFWRGDFFTGGRGAAAALKLFGNIAILVGILFAVLGIAYTFDGKKKEKAFYVRAVSMLVFVVLSSAVAWGIIVPGVGLRGGWLGGLGFLRSTKIHGYRFMVLARAAMLYFSAYGLTRLIEDRSLPKIAGLGKFSLAGKFRWPILVPVCGTVFLSANLPFFFHDRTLDEIMRNPFFPARDSALLKTSSGLSTARDLMKVCEWLRQKGADENRRVFFQDTLGNALLISAEVARSAGEESPLRVVTTEDTVTHFCHLPAIAPVYSGKPQIGSWVGGNLFPIEKISLSESGTFLGSTVKDFDDEELVVEKRILQRLNIHYLVTCEPRLRSRLKSSRYFAHRETFGAFDIFELPDLLYITHDPGWAYFSLPARHIPDNKVEVSRFDNHAIDISFENYATLVDLHVAVSYHPFWKASVDGLSAPQAGGSTHGDHRQGKPIRVESDDIGLIKIPLEVQDQKGRQRSLLEKHTLTLRYVPSRGISTTVSLLSTVLSVVFLVLPIRERAPSEAG